MDDTTRGQEDNLGSDRSQFTRRHFLKSALASAGVILLAACAPAAPPAPTAAPAKPAGAPAAAAKPAGPQPEVVQITDDLIKAAKAEGTVTVRYSNPADTAESFARSFTEAHGIKVQLDRKQGVLGNQQFATEERAGQHVMDVNWTADPPGLRKLGEEGLYLAWTPADLEKKFRPGTYISPWGYGFYWTEIVIQYNPKLIPHAEAKQLFKTWDGLLDPKLKGKVGLTEPGGGGTPFSICLMWYQTPKYGRDFLVKLAAQSPRVYPASAPAREDLSAGAISVFAMNWESIAFTQFKKGDPTAWTYPDMAPAFNNVYTAINKNAPHPKAARLFAAWINTPEGAKAVQKADLRPNLEGVTDERDAIPLLKKTDWWEPYPDKTRWVPDQKYWDENYDRLMPDMRAVLGWKG